MTLRRLISKLLPATSFALFQIISPAAGPSAPKPITEISGISAWYGGSYVALRWDTRALAVSYVVYRNDGFSSSFKRLASVPALRWSYIDFELPSAETMVVYRVYSIDRRGSKDLIGQSASLPLKTFRRVKPLARKRSASTLDNQSSNTPVFDKNDIVTDMDFTNSASMSADQIQQFLNNHQSVLANYTYGGTTASQIIAAAALANNINPEVLLVTLQKEEALVTSTSATPQQLALAMGYGAATDFYDQVYGAAQQFRAYLNNLAGYGWTVGQTHSVSDGTVTPVNESTAALYIYTPWIGQGGGGETGVGGNYLFWDIWYNQFEFSQSPSSTGDPDVAALANSTQTVYWYYFQDGSWYIVDQSNAVLALEGVDPSFADGILWKPINNYPAYAGYSAAGINFSHVTLSPDNRSVDFGFPWSTDVDVLHLSLSTQTISWFFMALNDFSKWYIVLNTPNNPAVLKIAGVDANFSGGILWKPINNYGSYAGYPAAGTAFSYVSISSDGKSVTFGPLQ